MFEFIEQWSFGDLVTTSEGELFVNHVPFVIDKEMNKIYGHFAIKNPQLALLEKAADLLVIFKGAYTYISPNWYVSQEMVPTWNFESVQVRGKAKLVSDGKLLTILEQLSEKHERLFENLWSLNNISESKINTMMKMIVGFEIDILTIKGKSKLSQNRSVEDRAGVISGLRAQNASMASIIADKMESGILP
ncbi:MAG: FMN-binding negative transcriptional regulator [Methylococcaceae bacterium]|nr:FMN-binding negative transcriptional regulator [Methylococcaceae bacterium]